MAIESFIELEIFCLAFNCIFLLVNLKLMVELTVTFTMAFIKNKQVKQLEKSIKESTFRIGSKETVRNSTDSNIPLPSIDNTLNPSNSTTIDLSSVAKDSNSIVMKTPVNCTRNQSFDSVASKSMTNAVMSPKLTKIESTVVKFPPFFRNLLIASAVLFTSQIALCVVQGFMIVLWNELEPHKKFFDATIGTTYAVGRFGVVLIFIRRLLETFKGSVYGISQRVYTVLIGVSLFVLILWVIVSFNIHWHVMIINSTILVYMWGDTGVNIIVLRMFLKRLNKLKKNIDDQNGEIFGKIVKKYAYLQSLAFFTTLTASFICPVVYYVTGIAWVGRILINVDATFNTYVAYYSMAFVSEKYNKYCVTCEERCLGYLRCCGKKDKDIEDVHV